MKKTIVFLLTLIFVFFSIAEVKAESYYLYCHDRTFMGDPAYSHIDIIAFQYNGVILLRFNKYGPFVSKESAYSQEENAHFIYYEHTPAFGVFSYPYLYIFGSRLLYCTPGTADNCTYSAAILTLEYGSWRDGLFLIDGFILRESWQASYSEAEIFFGTPKLNAWTRHVPSNQLIYRIGYQSQ